MDKTLAEKIQEVEDKIEELHDLIKKTRVLISQAQKEKEKYQKLYRELKNRESDTLEGNIIFRH